MKNTVLDTLHVLVYQYVKSKLLKSVCHGSFVIATKSCSLAGVAACWEGGKNALPNAVASCQCTSPFSKTFLKMDRVTRKVWRFIPCSVALGLKNAKCFVKLAF